MCTWMLELKHNIYTTKAHVVHVDFSDITLPYFVDLEDSQSDMNFWQICDLTD